MNNCHVGNMLNTAAQTHCDFIEHYHVLCKATSKVTQSSQIQLIIRVDQNFSSGVYVAYETW